MPEIFWVAHTSITSLTFLKHEADFIADDVFDRPTHALLRCIKIQQISGVVMAIRQWRPGIVQELSTADYFVKEHK